MRVKVSPGRVKVEHDDAARVARETRAPLRDVLRRAEDEARRTGPQDDADPASSALSPLRYGDWPRGEVTEYGRWCFPAKEVRAQVLRGFESHPLRWSEARSAR